MESLRLPSELNTFTTPPPLAPGPVMVNGPARGKAGLGCSSSLRIEPVARARKSTAFWGLDSVRESFSSDSNRVSPLTVMEMVLADSPLAKTSVPVEGW